MDKRTAARRAFLRNAALTAGSVLLASSADATNRTDVKPGEILNVLSFGAAGDGKRDDTDAFERAIKQARSSNATVMAPRATYRLTRPLHLENQLLMGQVAGGWAADSIPMPILQIEQVDSPAIVMGAFSSLHGIAIVYPVNATFPSKNPPPAISLAGGGPTISSVRIQYAYDGIITAPGATPGRSRLFDIFMVEPHHTGLYLTRSYDVSQLHNIEIWNNGAMATGAGFQFGRNDDCALTDLFAFNCQIGYLFETDKSPGGGTFYGSLSNCSTDFCSQGCVVRGDHRINLSTADLVDHFTSLDVDGVEASIRMSNCHIQTNGSPAVYVHRCANLSINNCWFIRAFPKSDHHFIRADQCGSFTLTSCQFDPSSPGVLLGSGVERAIVANNIFESQQPAITNHLSPSAHSVLQGNIGAL